MMKYRQPILILKHGTLYYTRHSIAHIIFKMRRGKRNASLEIAMAEKTEITEKILC